MQRYFLGFFLSSALFADILYIQADRFKFEKNKATAIGNVTIEYKDYKIWADKVIYDKGNNTITAEGHVIVTEDDELYLRARKVVIKDRGNHTEAYYISGKTSEGYFRAEYLKKEGKVYKVYNGCASKCSDYQAEVCARKFILNKEKDYGVAYDAKVKIEKIPVLYTPYYSFLMGRHTGFLPPTLGFDSYKNFIYQQPFYWAINDYSDLTLTADYRSGKMYGIRTEYRKYFAKDFYLRLENHYYYDDNKGKDWWEGRNYYRKNRYLISGEGFLGTLKFGWEYPSDKDYYYDVFFEKEKYKYKSFARSYIDWSYQNRKLFFNLRTEYFYNLTTEDRDKDLAILPEGLLYLKETKIWKNLTFDLFADYTDFYTDQKSYHRIKLEPKFKFPVTLGTSYVTFYLKPFFVYYPDIPGDYDKHLEGFQLSADTILYDTQLVKTENWNWFTLFEGVYKFQPVDEDKRFPDFDMLDKYYKQNEVLLRNLNTLTYKGRQIWELLLEQPYNFEGGYYLPTDGTFIDNNLLPLKVYSNFTPIEEISYHTKIYYDYNLHKIFYQSHSISIYPYKTELSYLKLFGSYILSKTAKGEIQSEQYGYGIKGKYRHFVGSFRQKIDKEIDKPVLTTVEAGYQKECWQISLYYQNEYNRDSEKYEWSVYIVLTVFDKALNILLNGGES